VGSGLLDDHLGGRSRAAFVLASSSRWTSSGTRTGELGVDLLADEELELGLTLANGGCDDLGELHDHQRTTLWRASGPASS
jgi:hypothetical protein